MHFNYRSIIVLLLQLGLTALGQTSNVGVSEQRFNALQYHSTHNSYERDEGFPPYTSLTDQLDLYNVWNLELDLRWHEDNMEFWIFHDCLEDAGNASLNYYLNQILVSRRIQDGLIFLFFDAGEIGPCVIFPNIIPKPANWPDLLEKKLISTFGRDAIYTKEEFTQEDNRKWPSTQELLRRGKHIIFATNRSLDGIFFSTSKDFFITTGDENTPVTPANRGDDKLARHFAVGWICSFGDSGWDWAINNGYNFPASNCSDRGTLDPRLHPPMPTYVNASGFGIFGTWKNPYAGPNGTGLFLAIDRAKQHQDRRGASMIWIGIQEGTYSMANQRRVSTAVRLYSRGGKVRLE